MQQTGDGGLRALLGWVLFPLVPVVLEDLYYGIANLTLGPGPPLDPYDWNAWRWVLVLGPLVGYAFLAGATARLPDDHDARGWRSWRRRRSVWVGVGPWIGFLILAAAVLILLGMRWVLVRVISEETLHSLRAPEWTRGFGQSWVGWLLMIAVLLFGAYGWLPIAWAALRRARRIERMRRALQRGVLAVIGFLGTLFGGFWAATRIWRGYFFDPTIMQSVLVAALCLGLMSGCGSITVGEYHRRQFFHAMLMAWVLGLAILWRWWGRPRKGPPK